jgi:hypothetical protein
MPLWIFPYFAKDPPKLPQKMPFCPFASPPNAKFEAG